MNWFFLAIGAPFLWALVNISDDYLVAKFSKAKSSIGGLVLFSGLIGILVSLVIFLSFGVGTVSPLHKTLLLFTGALNLVWNTLYFFALTLEDVSVVVPWFLTTPVFGYIIGHTFLGESLTSEQLIGSLIVLLGGLIISISYEKRTFKIKEEVALLMLVACIISASTGILFKAIANTGDFWAASFWQYLGLGASGLIVFVLVPKYRESFFAMGRVGGGKILSLNIGSEIFTAIGNLMTTYATLLAPAVALVYLMASFQPVIVLFLAFICSKFFPYIVTEDFSWKRLWPKLLAISIMILGSALLLQ